MPIMNNKMKIHALVAIMLLGCGTPPPPPELGAILPPAPVTARLEENAVYGPLDFFKTGETVISATDAELKSFGDIVGLASTPAGIYRLVVRAWADTARAIQPRMTIRLGETEIATMRVRRAVMDYEFSNIAGTGDTLRIILADDYYDPATGEDVNIHVARVTFAFTENVFSAWLTWNANTEADLSGYNIYYDTASGQYGNKVNVGLDTSFSLSAFNDGLTRFFVVTAFDTAGNESDYSNVVVWMAPPPDTTTPPEVDTTIVNWPDDKTLRMRIIYQRMDATGKPLLPAIRLQMEKFDSLNAYGWYDKFKGVDYFVTDIDESTSIIAMNMTALKSSLPQTDGEYLWSIRFRVRLENPADALKSTAWVYGDKAIKLLQAPSPFEGVPLLPVFRLILE